MQTARLVPVRCCHPDRCRPPIRCPSVRSIFLMLLLVLPTALAAQGTQSGEIVRFKLRDRYLITVQAMVNGAGPFSFLLDNLSCCG